MFMCYTLFIYIDNSRATKEVELWMFSLETPKDVNQLNNKILGNVLFYTHIDYVVGSHNICYLCFELYKK